jgi:hypothetical protein
MCLRSLRPGAFPATLSPMTTTRNTTTKTRPPVEPQEVSINVPLPADLRRKVRIKQATDDISLKDAVVAALTEWVKS